MTTTDEAIAADNRAKVALLTPREREVLVLAAKGMSAKETAALMGVSLGTITLWRSRVYQKLDVSGDCEASVIAAKAGVV